MALLLTALTFLTTALVVLLAVLAAGRSRRGIASRLAESNQDTSERSLGAPAGPLIRDERLSTVPMLHRLLLHWSSVERLGLFLSQAGLVMKPGKFLLLSAVLGLGTFAGFFLGLNRPLPGAVLGLGVGLCPLGVVALLRARRLRKFERQFPDAMDLLARAIRAGHALTAGLEMLAREQPEPLAGEFRIPFEQHKLGIPLSDALFRLVARVPQLDVRIFVAALLIQKETGGNLAELLDNLSRIIRERFKIRGEVRVRTAQARATAILLLALPPVLLLALSILNIQYVRVLFTDPWGVTAMGIAATMQGLGSAIIWKMVRLEV